MGKLRTIIDYLGDDFKRFDDTKEVFRIINERYYNELDLCTRVITLERKLQRHELVIALLLDKFDFEVVNHECKTTLEKPKN